jgi:hypothetical protein
MNGVQFDVRGLQYVGQPPGHGGLAGATGADNNYSFHLNIFHQWVDPVFTKQVLGDPGLV